MRSQFNQDKLILTPLIFNLETGDWRLGTLRQAQCIAGDWGHFGKLSASLGTGDWGHFGKLSASLGTGD
ncbi:MAG: hypothetical protein HEQ19_25435 [Gloeotrichia echinulata CP02]|nr:hypothetical protein [Gloeotrichia echinulata DEX184]